VWSAVPAPGETVTAKGVGVQSCVELPHAHNSRPQLAMRRNAAYRNISASEPWRIYLHNKTPAVNLRKQSA
jgi:hypothetical protein